MSIQARYEDGVFKPLEKVEEASQGEVYLVFSGSELRGLKEDMGWLRASESSFAFWDNHADAAYDRL